MERYFPQEKILLTGNPVRQDLLEKIENKEEAISHFDLDKNKKTILVVGGSLGARTINESIIGDIDKIGNSEFETFFWKVAPGPGGAAARANRIVAHRLAAILAKR